MVTSHSSPIRIELLPSMHPYSNKTQELERPYDKGAHRPPFKEADKFLPHFMEILMSCIIGDNMGMLAYHP